MQKPSQISTYTCETVVLGGGIAGCWTALKLAEQGVQVILMTYEPTDRGGRLGATQISVGAINTSPITRPDFSAWLHELGRDQTQSTVVKAIVDYLPQELEALKVFDPLKSIELGLALASGSGRLLVEQLMDVLQARGVKVLRDAWVTAIEASEDTCRGVHFQRGEDLGIVQAASMVVASGGYSGLFQGSVKSGTFGSVLGRFMLAGGKLSNLEFIFKHGYGQPDLGKLTPTEELPGVEIYDSQGVHVLWLEEELFYGRGTHNHFQAFMTWRKDENTHYFVDFRYRNFHRQLKAILSSCTPESSSSIRAPIDIQEQFKDYVETSQFEAFLDWINPILAGEKIYDFAAFNALKPLLSHVCLPDRQRIRQIAYFSMGGIMHHGFLTNLKNVFVNGEAMHDFGAHRVGGLPWALYLSAARKIADDIVQLKNRQLLIVSPLLIQPQKSQFDGERLAKIQQWMYEFQERGAGESGLTALLNNLRTERNELETLEQVTDDAYAYLLLAEAIVLSSLARQESRGCFFRADFSDENYHFKHLRTLAMFDASQRQVMASCVDKTSILDLVANRGGGRYKMDCGHETQNAVYYLLKKHLHSHVAQKPALVFEGTTLNYEELNERVEIYAHWVFSQGLKQGDRMALWLQDGPDWIALFLASLQLGLVAVPLNTFAKEDDLIYYLNDAQATMLLTEQCQLDGLDVASILLKTSTTIRILEDLQPLPQFRLSASVPVDFATPAFILYTSGSTGKPKGALHDHHHFRVTAEQFGRQVLAPSVGDLFYSSSRLFFAYGLGNSLTFPLYFGGTSVLTRARLNTQACLSLLAQQPIDYFFSIPSIYAQLIEPLKDLTLVHTPKCFVSAGEPLSSDLAQKWVLATGTQFIDGLGSTEALHIFCYRRYSQNYLEPELMPVPGYELQLWDDRHFVMEKNNVLGQLVVRGASVARGYWQQPEASAKTFVQDWLLTGDWFQRSAKGDYAFLGRKGDMFKMSGLWVSTHEIETALSGQSEVSSAAVVVYLDDQGRQKTAAFIVPALSPVSFVSTAPFDSRAPFVSTAPEASIVDPLDPSIQDNTENLKNIIYQNLEHQLSRYKWPTYIHIISALPRTGTGKVAKLSLNEMAKMLDSSRQHPQISAPQSLEVIS